MFKKILVIGLVITALVALAAGLYQNTKAVSAEPETNLYGMGQSAGRGAGVVKASADKEDGAPVGQYGVAVHQDVSSPMLPAPSDLSQAEAEALVYMVEEEKLARDVYNELYKLWGNSTFTNIAASEQTHIDAIKNLLSIYGLEDPSSTQPGVFTNPELQELYTQQVETGSQSLADALKVGAAIEEVDILDLQDGLAQTDNADIQQVFESLLSGSTNHLRAFVNALQMQTGEIYVPQYMSIEAYQTILSETAGGFGNGRSRQGGNGGGGQGGNGWRGGQP